MNRTILAASSAISIVAFVCSPLVYAADVAQSPPPAVSTAGPAAAAPAASTPAASATAETGLAAVYSDRLNGNKTASGERYDRDKLTAAHKTLPFGTQVKVTNTKNKKTVMVRINDRGPTQAGRILDISPRAAKELGISPMGMAEVTAEVVGQAPQRGKN